MEQILIVDDDVYIGDMLEEALTKENYRIFRAYSGTEALLVLASNRMDMILLDLMLPGLSGDEVLARIENIPVIAISAKADVDSKVKILMAGAVDYVTKPFEVRELIARIKVHLKESLITEGEEYLSAEGLTLNLTSMEAAVNGRKVKLTRTEYAILKILMQNPSRVITKNIMLNSISAETPDCTERSLKQHISNLRKKLLSVADQKDYIETVWGIGIKLAE
jgi:DNA-binding response OmpR family regulator